MRLAALLLGIVLAGCAQAAPLYQASDDRVRVILYDEPCALAAVANLPLRAEWIEDGKSTEGCYAMHPSGLTVGYFADRSVVIIPTRAFRRVLGV